VGGVGPPLGPKLFILLPNRTWLDCVGFYQKIISLGTTDYIVEGLYLVRNANYICEMILCEFLRYDKLSIRTPNLLQILSDSVLTSCMT
jgi:hypothetical protein